MPAASIFALPREILDSILDELETGDLAIDSKSYYSCALVCSYWTTSSLCRLYRHLRIGSSEAATALAQSPALPRYSTLSLVVDLDYLSLDKSAQVVVSDIEAVVRHCSGLRELEWRGSIELSVVVRTLSNPALASLKVLSMLAHLHNVNMSEPGADFTFPFQVDSLTTNLSLGSHSLVSRVMAASLVNSKFTLRHLDLSQLQDVESLFFSCVSVFYLSPSALHSLTLPALDGVPDFLDVNLLVRDTVTLIRQSPQLSHLTLTTDGGSAIHHLPPTLTRLLDALDHSLESFTFLVTSLLLGADVLGVMIDATKVGGAFERLKRLKFPRATLSELALVESWSSFVAVMEERKVKVVVEKAKQE